MRATTLHRRTLSAVAAVGAAIVGAAACEPAADGLSAVAVAVTTDKTATSTLERLEFDVRWLTCTAKLTGGTKPSRTKSSGTKPARASAPPASGRAAEVDCNGETASGQDITLTGKVTEEKAGRCVRGDLTAKVDKKVVFQATLLGDCSAAPSNTPPATHRPTTAPRPGVTVTETVTVTATPDPPPQQSK
ncbi:hypothetical protein AB0M39_31530 [Streptomyces sp. NPDC051907]|uniref:hypothetical protein n=1 Tax=Streptomyces sp. NPDC051907 TaxID=3155284 RepID=UPI00343E432D